jgi:ribosomal protein S18 acetylase RimI-like enzyme
VELRKVTAQAVTEIAALVTQLSTTAQAPTRAQLEQIAASPTTRLLVARRVSGTLAGMLTLLVYRLPTGVRAQIDDVVVHKDARGRGVARALTARAMQIASAEGARTVDLTSRPSRVAANRLYQQLGFQPRDTNVYRFQLT